MIKLTGVLNIRTISGRNGNFNVGRLVTDIGEFAVKDTLLDQYDTGCYEGDFGITRIYPSQYSTGSRVVTEVRAVLASMALANIEHLDYETGVSAVEPDPVDETESAPPAPAPVASSKESVEGDAADAPDEDAALFGDLWPLGGELRLDPTVDRMRFRQQLDRLKQLGYRFQALGQVWIKPVSITEQAA